jgi:transposase
MSCPGRCLTVLSHHMVYRCRYSAHRVTRRLRSRVKVRPGLALVVVSVVEQRYRAVLEVQARVPVSEVASRFGVSRQSVHAWIRRYEEGGLGALADRSRRPESCPHQVPADVEAAVCEARREHPRWGPVRIVHELRRAGVVPVPSRMSVYRVLVRHGLVEAGQRKRRKDSYLRWERDEPMALWQLDIVGGSPSTWTTRTSAPSGGLPPSRSAVSRPTSPARLPMFPMRPVKHVLGLIRQESGGTRHGRLDMGA